MRVVIGGRSTCKQDFRSLVGIISKGHVESDDAKITDLTSSVVTQLQVDRDGGVVGRGISPRWHTSAILERL